ncbi:MAG: aminotransferase class III-fold pyridoxal phosphate-dependent enzyme [Candidatus Heimdallarchaeota archaeon]|nr:aminotransferase class III-fold pyridoxal phosphate-dependent enzyme [Candidatus Heimdallarchaeota archaeon]
MNPVDVSKPVFKEVDILSHLSKEYKLSGNLQSLPSYRDQNFLLSTNDQTQLVCKIANLNDNGEYLEAQNKIINHLQSKNNQLVSNIISSVNQAEITNIYSELGTSFYFRVLTYLPGIVYANYKPHSAHFMYSFGVFMAEMRTFLADLDIKLEKIKSDWDMESSLEILKKHIIHIVDNDRSNLIQHYLRQFELDFQTRITDLDKGIIHGDANNYNVLVQNPSELSDKIKFGLIDFGDFAYSSKIADLAIAIAYAILDKPNPIATMMQIVRGYSSKHQLQEKEIEILFSMILIRLCVSVTMSAHQRKLDPNNEYISISATPAWKALFYLKDISTNFVYYLIRSSCGYTAHPKSDEIITWLKSQSFESIFEDIDNYEIIDLSFGSLDIQGFQNADNLSYYSKIIEEKSKGIDLVIGRYAESRLMYIHDSFEKVENEYLSWRSVHLGIDLFKKTGTAIQAPMSGEVYRVSIHDDYLDYGPTVLLKHQIDEDTHFYTLYGHLMSSSIKNLHVGQIIKRGETFAKIGDVSKNGSWTPHVHVQIILDLLNYESSFPGVCSNAEKLIWLSLCPDPNLILNLVNSNVKDNIINTQEITELRGKHHSDALSISYQKPLHIVRGYAQHLYDVNGRRYLDAVNNVPIVGHSHPNVIRALTRQASVLNTNTRYLQEILVSYTKKLLSYFPEELEVCFFVNSGSEANELALRLAAVYTSRDDFIVLDHAYHGNTNATISISPYKFNSKGGKGKPSNVHVVAMPYPYRGKYQGENTGSKYAEDVTSLVEQLQQNGTPPAAFIAESLPGVGGQILIPPNYFPKVYKSIRDSGGVCIADEVQVGFARMGSHYWGFETYGVVPDIVTLGKPIGNGHPMGAVITTRKIADAFANGMEFFSTTGGNTVSMAVGLSVLNVIEENNLQKNSKLVGEYLLNKLTEIGITTPIIGDVRGRGLYLGIEVVKDKLTKIPAPDMSKYIVEQMKDRGVLLSVDGPDHNVIKIKPPLVFSIADANVLISTLTSVLSHSCL